MAILPLTDDRVRTGPADRNHVTPSIAAHPAGGYVMAWASLESGNWGIYVARYAAADSLQEDGVRVNADTSVSQRLFPAVTVLPSGMYVVTWTDQSVAGPEPDPSEWGVRGRLFDASGAPVGTEFLVNTTTLGLQWQSEGVALAGGGFVIEWQNANYQTHQADSRAQIFNASGAKVGGEIVVGSDRTSITALPDGGFLSAYSVFISGSGEMSQARIAAQRFDASGNKVGPELAVLGQTQMFVHEVETATLSNGGFVVAWVADGAGGDGSAKGIRAQVFDASGAPVGSTVSVNSNTTGDQFQLDLSALPGGGFAAIWSDSAGSGGDGSSYSIKGQVFDPTGAKVDGEFLVNLKTSSIQQNPAITTLGGGHITIAWQDHNQAHPTNGGDYDIRTRTFSVPLTGTEGDDSFTGTRDTDQFVGKGGNDIFVFPTVTNSSSSTWGYPGNADTVDGGAGDDRLVVSGAVLFQLGPQSLLNVETIQLLPAGPGKMFPARNFTMHDNNVAAGLALRIDASLLPYGEQLLFYGQNELDGRFIVLGGASNDFIIGGQQEDVITGGLLGDYLRGNGGSDYFHFNGIDEIRGDDIGGGAGFDQMILTGDMSAGALAGVTLTGVEQIILNSAGPGGYYSYNFTLADAMVAAGASLTVDGSNLRNGESLMFYGNGEADGSLIVRGGSGSDYIFGGQRDDTIQGGGARDILRGLGGNDTFLAVGTHQIRDDDIAGGAGYDTLVLSGLMASGALVGVTMTEVEEISLSTGGPVSLDAYNLTTTDPMVAAGQTMKIDGSGLFFGNTLMFYGDAETDGSFIVLGGGAKDYIFGSQNADTIRGGLGGDYLRGNGGADILVYQSASESQSTAFDQIVGFDRSADRFDLPVAVTGFGGEVNQGRLSSSTFNADMAAAMNGVLGSGQAALFNPDSGTFAGRSFLVVDGNGTAGYQAGADYVFEMVNPTAPMTGPADYFI